MLLLGLLLLRGALIAFCGGDICFLCVLLIAYSLTCCVSLFCFLFELIDCLVITCLGFR